MKFYDQILTGLRSFFGMAEATESELHQAIADAGTIDQIKEKAKAEAQANFEAYAQALHRLSKNALELWAGVKVTDLVSRAKKSLHAVTPKSVWALLSLVFDWAGIYLYHPGTDAAVRIPYASVLARTEQVAWAFETHKFRFAVAVNPQWGV